MRLVDTKEKKKLTLGPNDASNTSFEPKNKYISPKQHVKRVVWGRFDFDRVEVGVGRPRRRESKISEHGN